MTSSLTLMPPNVILTPTGETHTYQYFTVAYFQTITTWRSCKRCLLTYSLTLRSSKNPVLLYDICPSLFYSLEKRYSYLIRIPNMGQSIMIKVAKILVESHTANNKARQWTRPLTTYISTILLNV
jgi:hypothetical protein